MNIKDYHNSTALGSSDVRSFIIMQNAHKWQFRKELNKESGSMNLGSLVHKLVLEPEDFFSEYVVSPHDDFRKKEAKEWKAEKIDAGLIILKKAEYEIGCNIRDAIFAHSGAKKVFEGEGINERSYFWTDPETGLELKYRPDRIKGDSVIDLKTTKDASPEGFSRSVSKFGYWQQSGFYKKGFESEFGRPLKHFFIVAVETHFPFEVAVYEIDMKDVVSGALVINHALNQIKKVQESQEYLGYNNGKTHDILSVNSWEIQKHMEVIYG